LGVELRWVKSTPAERAHFRETFFKATVPAAPEESPDTRGSGPSGLKDQDAARNDGPDDDRASWNRGAATSHRGPSEDANAGPTPEAKERSDHRGEAAETAVDLFESGLKEHLADRLAECVGDKAFEIIDKVWTPEHCEMLAALADKIDQLHSLIRNGIASGVRIVVRWAGASDFTAALLGELVASAVDVHFLYPLTGIATMLRVAGTVCCTACGCAGDCACARGLAKDLFTRYLKWLFGVELDRVPMSTVTNKIVAPGIYVTYEFFKNRGPDDSGGARQEPWVNDWDFWATSWRPTSPPWSWDFSGNPSGPDGPAAQPRTGPADGAAPTDGSGAADASNRTTRDDDPSASPDGAGYAATGATAGSISALAGMTAGGPSEPPAVAGFGSC
jgi:hypothetical protein